MSTPAIPKQQHYPPYVITEADQARWDLSMAIAETTIAELGDGTPDTAFLWSYARTVYHSELPTGDPAELGEAHEPEAPADDAPAADAA